MKVLVLISIMLLTSCATVHRKNYAVQVDDANNMISSGTKGLMGPAKTRSGLVVSGEINNRKSAKYFGYIDMVFENMSQEWLVIKKVAITFGSDKINKSVKFVSGLPLEVYIKAVNERLRVAQKNKDTANAILAGIGVAAAQNAKKSSANAALLGAAVSLSVADFNKSRGLLNAARIFPEDHLFASEFIVPPGMFRLKWVVLNTRDHKDIGLIKDIFITYWFKDGKSEKIKLPIRSFWNRNNAVWQK